MVISDLRTRRLFGRILLPSAANVELFTSQGREIMMSFTEDLLVDEPLDFFAPHLPGLTDNEFGGSPWSDIAGR